jgi:hypothetical protein
MALQSRHLFMAQRVDEALGIRNEAITEELVGPPTAAAP